MTGIGFNNPNMPIDVKTAKTPPAGVNPPYIHDWKLAAIEPVFFLIKNDKVYFKEERKPTSNNACRTET